MEEGNAGAGFYAAHDLGAMHIQGGMVGSSPAPVGLVFDALSATLRAKASGHPHPEFGRWSSN